MENLPELHEAQAKNRFNNWIAVSIAVLATFMAVTKIKDDNIVQAMLQVKSDAVDTWGEYQAKHIKHHLLEVSRDQARALQLTVSASGTAQLQKQMQHYESEMARYLTEATQLRTKARDFEAQYDKLNFRDDQFDVSDAMLSVSLAMLALTVLTGKRWLFVVSWVFAAVGVVMGIAGLCGFGLHPNWLTRLLS